MKNVFLIFLLSICSYTFYGQTLVSYGKQTISREEFLAAFRKNNTHTHATEKAYRDYLNLYIRYKLKVQAAKDLTTGYSGGTKHRIEKLQEPDRRSVYQ